MKEQKPCYFTSERYSKKHIYPQKYSMFLRKLLILSLIGSATLLVNQTQAYMIGFKSADNTVENIQTIESTYNVNLPIVSFIFDPWSPDILDTINKLPSTL